MNGTIADKKVTVEYITLLNVLAAFSVVFLHTNGCFWEFCYDGYWFSANVIECVFYFAVPVFFMITGATLMDYRDRYSTRQFAMRRVKKTVVPFLAWSLFGLGCIIARGGPAADGLSLGTAVNRILSGSVVNVYWFFPALFSVYLCIPLLAAVPKGCRKEVFTYVAIAAFVVNNLIPFLRSLFFPDFVWLYKLAAGSEYLLYAIIGWLLHTYDLPKRGRAAIYVSALAGLMLHMAGTYKLSVAAGDVVATFKGYNNVPCILYSVGIFVFFKEHGDRIMNSFLRKPIRFLSQYTFGIYLCHIYLLNPVQEFFTKVFSSGYDSLLYRLGAPFVIVPLAVAIVYLMRKIPIVRQFVP